MFDKYLCKHIQKSGISLLDIFNYVIHTWLFCAMCVLWLVVFASYAAGDIYHVFIAGTATDLGTIGLKENLKCGGLIVVGGSFIIILASFVLACIKAAFNMKIAHCPLKKEK